MHATLPSTFNVEAAKSDLSELDAQIRLTDQIIARLMELTHRRKIHRANLVLAKGKLATALTIDLLDNGRDYDQPVATSRKISFTPGEREIFYAGLARNCAGAEPTLDPSTSQLPTGFIDNDHDGHG